MDTTPKIKKTPQQQASMDQQSTQSGAVVGSNDTLLTDILLRLPVTSILRFKSVSKHWYSLLGQKHFTHRYDTHSKSPGVFARDKYIPFDAEDPNTPPVDTLSSYIDSFTSVRVLQSCNGLLLCCTDQWPKIRKSGHKYYVFNPTTKQLALIPSVLGGLKARKTIRFMGLAFHQTDCAHYKVVCIRNVLSYVESYQVQVYSSDTREWKISTESFSATKPVFFGQGVYWKGAVYWAPYYENSDHLYFKIDAEQAEQQLGTLPLPVGLTSSKIMTMYFGESRGHLHLILHMDRGDDSLLLNVYEMLSDHSGWFVKYQVQLGELLGAFPEMVSEDRYDFKVIDVVRGEEEGDSFVVLKTSKRIITYNVHDKSFKLVLSFAGHSYEGSLVFHRYTETLSLF
ncbi:putative F-box domain-containing protein [Helianthus annuus]|uniref:F-box domain-containing protein n=1 Tax=Helianthus annuus TaxID=4232 RepID=A0A9K3H0B9_HELAN|nr:F-box protein At5g07610 [Helianthus annuus]KAF5761818.1 putative F-box domain-containing protein [Helianthus annuus]KAJ0444752.1 putative F-box domain-containing protein [Helianthus annuus]KAJ0461983.1 putative F-box domain-containing protein [Helianthus annuus]KAJ0646253.1 putative F-box domain-containing protein [Helianthus annuus]KAJ0822914.1 putative F-box domain-containing protein [Helianthus annuus]